MTDDLHHLVRMHQHDDLEWCFAVGGAIELHACSPSRERDARLDCLCARLGFESIGNGAWRVAPSSPHYEDLWVFVEQERIDQAGE